MDYSAKTSETSTETLKDALVRVGDTNAADLLTPEAQNLTKSDVTHFLNNHDNHNLDKQTVTSLIHLSKQRMKEGKSIFPWTSMEDVEHTPADENLEGGVCW